jgi:hypothetical protein
MIKFFKTQDVLTTRFVVAKPQVIDNIFLDLIFGNDGDDVTFPITVPFLQCNNNFSGSCEPIKITNAYLADTNFIQNDIPDFYIGKYLNSSSIFYPSSSVEWSNETNPVNINGTYKGQIYNTIDKMYYNNYNNAYNRFGLNDTVLQNKKLNLANEFSLYSLAVNQAGDTIRPNTVVITNQTGDVLSDIYDDGNNNLFLTGSHFVDYYQFSSNSTSLVTSYGQYGLSYYLKNSI